MVASATGVVASVVEVVTSVVVSVTGVEASEARVVASVTEVEASETGVEAVVTGVEVRVTGVEARVTGVEATVTGVVVEATETRVEPSGTGETGVEATAVGGSLVPPPSQGSAPSVTTEAVVVVDGRAMKAGERMVAVAGRVLSGVMAPASAEVKRAAGLWTVVTEAELPPAGGPCVCAPGSG